MNPLSEVEALRAEVAWLDERINVVRELAYAGLRENPETHLAAILQQLSGVSRTTSAKPDDG